MEYLRKKYVCSNQIKKGVNGVREAVEYIKNNYSIALMVDQRVSEGEKLIFLETCFNNYFTCKTIFEIWIRYNTSLYSKRKKQQF